MKVHHSKHSKRSAFASIVILIVIGLIFFLVTSCSKEEKAENQDNMKNGTNTDISKNLQPVNVEKNLIIDIKKDSEIWIENEKVDLDSIKSRIEDFKNEYPDGNVIITCDKDLFNNKAIAEVID